MSTRSSEAKSGEATVVSMPRAEKPSGAPDAVEAAAPVAAPKKKGNRRLVLMIVVPLVIAIGGGYFWLTGGRYQDTDNAYVQQAKVSISADIAGRIVAVNVAENQAVKSGDVLFTIDAEPYQIALDSANAALASARVNVEQLKVSFGTAQAQLAAAQSTLELRQAAFDRKNSLVQSGNASDATLDDVKLALEQAQNAVIAAKQQVAGATAALGGDPTIATDDHPAVRAAHAAVQGAERNLSKTQVKAPADGIVSQVASLNVGQFIATGTTIASLVESSGTWVVANFKETQLGEMRAGEPAEVVIDAYPGKLEGVIDSIGAATGSEFSLIPAQNATGNWVKVVQRIPVRIELPSVPEAALLKTGMSAAVKVDTGHSELDKLLGR